MPRLTLEVALVVRVACDGRDLFTYIHLPDETASQAPRPYLHPMRALSGEVVSLARPHDARWHRGLSFAIPRVGRHDLWGGPGPAADRGSMDHQHFTEIRERTDHVAFGHELVWHGRSGTGLDAGPELVRERRNLRVAVAAEDAWVLTWESVLTNISGEDLPLAGADGADPGAGGLFWRGPRSFTGGTLLLPDGATNDDAHGRAAAWAGFTGRHDETGAASTVVLVDDEANPGHPAHWSASAQPYAALGPTPFREGPVSFGPDETLTFRYAVVVGDGTADVASAADLAALGRESLVAAAAPPPPPTLGTFLSRRDLRRAAASAPTAAVAPLVAEAEPVSADQPVAQEPPTDEVSAEESAAAGAAPVVAVPMLAQVPFVAQVPLAAPEAPTPDADVAAVAEGEIPAPDAEPAPEVAELATAPETLEMSTAVDAEPEPEPEADQEPEPEPVAGAEPETEPEADQEPEPEPVADAEPETEPEAEIEAVPGEPADVADEDWAAAVDEVVLPELAESAPDEEVQADGAQPDDEPSPDAEPAPEVADGGEEPASDQVEPEPEPEPVEPEPEPVEPQDDVAPSWPVAAEATLVLPALPPDDEPDEVLPSPFEWPPAPAAVSAREADAPDAEAEPVTPDSEAEPVTAESEAEPVTAERPAVSAPITPPPPSPAPAAESAPAPAPAPARQSAWARASAPPTPPDGARQDDAPTGPVPSDAPFVPVFLPVPAPEPADRPADQPAPALTSEPDREPCDATGVAAIVPPPPPPPAGPQPPSVDAEAAAAVEWLGSAPAEEVPVPRPAWAPVQADDSGDRATEPWAGATGATGAVGAEDQPEPGEGSPWAPPPLLEPQQPPAPAPPPPLLEPQQSPAPAPAAPAWPRADDTAHDDTGHDDTGHDDTARDQPAPDEPAPFFWAPPPSPFGEPDDGPADLSAARQPEPEDDGPPEDEGRRRPWWSRG